MVSFEERDEVMKCRDCDMAAIQRYARERGAED